MIKNACKLPVFLIRF